MWSVISYALPFAFRLTFGLFASLSVAGYVMGTDSIRGVMLITFPLHLMDMVSAWIWEEVQRP